MTQHTPGPWTVGHTRTFTHSGGIFGTETAVHYGDAVNRGNCIAHAYGHGALSHSEDDARLIAAAPDLLEALKEMLANPAGDYDTTDDYEKACKKAHAAIAKATGGAA
jgi:hypothetical protein